MVVDAFSRSRQVISVKKKFGKQNYVLSRECRSEGSRVNPVRTQRHFNVHTTSFKRYGRCMDVGTTLCAYRKDL